MWRFITRKRDRARPYCSCRLRGGPPIPGTSSWFPPSAGTIGRSPSIAAAPAQALWSGQTTVEQFRRHEGARLTWDALGRAAEVKVPALVLCGEDDDVERRGSTPVGTARKLGGLIPGAELALIPGVKHMTFWDGSGALSVLRDFLARHPIKSTPVCV